MDLIFTAPDAWSGGSYELVFQLPRASDVAVKQALEVLWNTPPLEGCYHRTDLEPSEQRRLSPSDPAYPGPHRYGIATLPNGKMVAAGSYSSVFDETNGWIGAYVPMGALGQAYPVGGYPFGGKKGPSPESWMRAVNAWFRSIAEVIYPSVGFTRALIGFEVPLRDMEFDPKAGIPSVRWNGLLIPSHDGLLWYPPTTYEPPFT